ncbi:MAG: hypothetical protein RLZ00_1004 [Pseudomonadota bacterium]|jgi:hypothetical protein
MQPEKSDSKPWWKYGHVWLIISGPVIVIVAGFITLAIAIGTPDPVVADDYYRRGLDINKTLAAEKDLQLAPALQTRNHVVTPKPETTKP